MTRRFSTIRARITLLVSVPLLSLVALWTFVTGVSFEDAYNLLQSGSFQQKVVLPTQRVVDTLQKERRQSTWRLGSTEPPTDGSTLAAQRAQTDKARAELRSGAADRGVRKALNRTVSARIDSLLQRLDTLDAVRRGIDERTTDRGQVLRVYSGMIDAGFEIYSAVAPKDGATASDARTLTAFGRAHEYLAREDALISGAQAAGRVTGAERAQFAQLVGARRYLADDTLPGLRPADRHRYQRLTASPEFQRLQTLEDEIIRGRAPKPGKNARAGQAVTAGSWRSSAEVVTTRLLEFENQVLAGVTERAEGMAGGVLTRLAIAGGLGLLAVVVSALIAWRVARRLVRECRTLAGRVVEFASFRLPALAEQVRAGGDIDPSAEEVYDDRYEIKEIRQISSSFARTRRAVLIAASGEVAARRGLSEVFVNLARRNQALLHRQLSLLDTMERRVEDPSELSDLFRLDHLATRMRRHAEGLVILAGKTAGRGWRKPVPLVDVVRGAVAEVEDYPRVRVQPLPRIALLGSAVADVIHLIAEIVENATTFSPPQAPVLVSGHAVGNGYVLEVEDRGLGMDEDQVRNANRRLADPPEFDPADSAQLGLFVVARLAQRHGIKVTLRPSPYGGTTAIALLPASLIVEDPGPDQALRRSTGPMKVIAPPQAVADAAPAEGVVRLVADPVQAEFEPAPASPAPAPAPATAQAPEPAADEPPALTADGLPRRRRQANLAPQLRERVDARLAAEGRAPAPAPAPAPEPDPAPEPAEPSMPLAAPVPPSEAEADPDAPRSPEAMRSMMSAMQAGWRRGRHEAGQDDSGPSHPEQEDDTP